MSLRDFINEIRDAAAEGVVPAVRELLYRTKIAVLRRLNEFVWWEDDPIDREWDILVIIDACRVDLWDERSIRLTDDETTIWSPGSMSEEWITKVLANRDLSDTAYVTGNMYADSVGNLNIGTIDKVYNWGWDELNDTVDPEQVTLSAIEHARDGRWDRVIVHYMQPHYPFVPIKIGEGELGDGGEGNVWSQLEAGDLNYDTVWEAYRENLNYVLSHVETLSENVDGKMVITSDHGNAVGEWGVYGHPKNVPIPALRRVPWAELDCTDKKTITDIKIDRTPDEIEDKLEALGYV